MTKQLLPDPEIQALIRKLNAAAGNQPATTGAGDEPVPADTAEPGADVVAPPPPRRGRWRLPERPTDSDDEGEQRLRGLLVSADFFDTLGAKAARGRTFRSEEEQPGRERVAVVSHGLWQRRFGGDPGVEAAGRAWIR